MIRSTMRNIARELEEASIKGKLKEYLREWKLESITRYKEERPVNVLLSYKQGDYFIQIITACNAIAGSDQKYAQKELINIKLKKWICEAINEIYR